MVPDRADGFESLTAIVDQRGQYDGVVAWYKDWFGEKYLALYAHRDAEEAERHVNFVERVFAADVAPKTPRAVLDLASGAGRHTEALRRRGYRALGIDLSLTLLAQVPGLPRVAGDMRYLPFASESFDWVLNFFTSFGYFEGERENFEVLEEINRLLAPDGGFLIDLFNREKVISELVAEETQERDGTEIEIERWYDADAQRVNKRIRLVEGDKSETHVESVRAYRKEEVTIGLQWAGLEVSGVYGSFDGESFRHDSQRLIVVGRKPG